MTERRADKGFTLLEVMVALSIIATALVTLLGTHLMNLNLAQKHKEQTMAVMLAREKLGEISTIPFEALTSGSGDFGVEYTGCEWELDVEESDIEYLKKVTILIKLPETEFELETMLARPLIE